MFLELICRHIYATTCNYASMVTSYNIQRHIALCRMLY